MKTHNPTEVQGEGGWWSPPPRPPQGLPFIKAQQNKFALNRNPFVALLDDIISVGYDVT